MFITDIDSKERENAESVHVVNIDIQDNHEEAVIGAFMICDLCALVSALHTTTKSRIQAFETLFIADTLLLCHPNWAIVVRVSYLVCYFTIFASV